MIPAQRRRKRQEKFQSRRQKREEGGVQASTFKQHKHPVDTRLWKVEKWRIVGVFRISKGEVFHVINRFSTGLGKIQTTTRHKQISTKEKELKPKQTREAFPSFCRKAYSIPCPAPFSKKCLLSPVKRLQPLSKPFQPRSMGHLS